METPTKFDLTNAIGKWHAHLASSPELTAEDVDELQAHLYDSVSRLQNLGLSPEESFLIAVRRIGHHQLLKKEFGKVNQGAVWIHRLFWMLIGIQAWELVQNTIASVATNGLCYVWQWFGFKIETSHLALPVTVFMLARLLVIGASVLLCSVIFRKAERARIQLLQRLKKRNAFIVSCTLLFLVMFLVQGVALAFPILLFKSSQLAFFAAITTSAHYANALLRPLEVGTMIVLTLLLARKQFPLSPAVAEYGN